jgi:hypothetical protein
MLILIQNLNLLINYQDQISTPSGTNLFSKQRENRKFGCLENKLVPLGVEI